LGAWCTCLVTMSDVLPVRSDCCGLDEMFLAYVPGEAERARLELHRNRNGPGVLTFGRRGAQGVFALAGAG